MLDVVLSFQGEGARAVPLSGHVGFDSMPDQLVNKSVNHGFCFNILCVGEYVFILYLWVNKCFLVSLKLKYVKYA